MIKTSPIVSAALGAIIIMNGYLVVSSLNTNKKVADIEQSTREVVGTVTQLQEEVRELTAMKVAAKLDITDQERQCLIKNVFHEAGVESLHGKIAVAQVVLERAKTNRWGSNFCSVIHSRAQFSWTLKKSLVHQKPKGKLWDDSVHAVEKFIAGYRIPELKGAKFYHTDYITTPKWADKRKKIAQIGRHVFYTQAL